MPHSIPQKNMDHPSKFASSLRKDDQGLTTNSLRKDGSWHSGKRDSFGGSMSSLRKDHHHHGQQHHLLQVPLRRNSKVYSTDSLDGRRNSWDPGRRGSAGSGGGFDDGRVCAKVEIGEVMVILVKVRNGRNDIGCFLGCIFRVYKKCSTMSYYVL